MDGVLRQAPFELWGSPVRRNVTRMLQTMQARRAADGERGAVLVEFALVVVLMMTLVFGIVEFSLAWNVKSQASAAVRAGGRTASALTRSDNLTANAADAVGAALKSIPSDEPKYVMVYEVTPGNDGSPPATCAANCAQYRWDAPTQKFITNSRMAGSGWPATAQQNNISCGGNPGVGADQFDQVGVYVKVDHPFIAIQNFVPGMASTVTLDPHSVFKLEPSSSTACTS
jgi:Flp pilus assembly protein TadG